MTTAITETPVADQKFVRGLGLLDSTMLVAGSMIGSGIFIVSADIARLVGSPGWLLVVWTVTGVLTLLAALCYGELAAMMPRAGGQYVYLREAYSPLWGFLYGWTLFLVIQTGTIAAVAVAFARFLGVFTDAVSPTRWILPPIMLSQRYAVSLSTQQLVAIANHHIFDHREYARPAAWETHPKCLHVREDAVALRIGGAWYFYRTQLGRAPRQLREFLDADRCFSDHIRSAVRRSGLRHRQRAWNGYRDLCWTGWFPVFRRRLEQHHIYRG